MVRGILHYEAEMLFAVCHGYWQSSDVLGPLGAFPKMQVEFHPKLATKTPDSSDLYLLPINRPLHLWECQGLTLCKATAK